MKDFTKFIDKVLPKMELTDEMKKEILEQADADARKMAKDDPIAKFDGHFANPITDATAFIVAYSDEDNVTVPFHCYRKDEDTKQYVFEVMPNTRDSEYRYPFWAIKSVYLVTSINGTITRTLLDGAPRHFKQDELW